MCAINCRSRDYRKRISVLQRSVVVTATRGVPCRKTGNWHMRQIGISPLIGAQRTRRFWTSGRPLGSGRRTGFGWRSRGRIAGFSETGAREWHSPINWHECPSFYCIVRSSAICINRGTRVGERDDENRIGEPSRTAPANQAARCRKK